MNEPNKLSIPHQIDLIEERRRIIKKHIYVDANYEKLLTWPYGASVPENFWLGVIASIPNDFLFSPREKTNILLTLAHLLNRTKKTLKSNGLKDPVRIAENARLYAFRNGLYREFAEATWALSLFNFANHHFDEAANIAEKLLASNIPQKYYETKMHDFALIMTYAGKPEKGLKLWKSTKDLVLKSYLKIPIGDIAGCGFWIALKCSRYGMAELCLDLIFQDKREHDQLLNIRNSFSAELAG